MLIGRLVTYQFISSSVVAERSLIDGSQNTVWPLALENGFCRILKNAAAAVKELLGNFVV